MQVNQLQKIHLDAPKLAFLHELKNRKKNYGEGAQPSSQTSPPVGRGVPSPHPTSIIALLVLDLTRAFGAQPRRQWHLGPGATATGLTGS